MKMKLGSIAEVPSAAMNPHSVPVEVTKVEIFTGNVLIELVRNSESRNSVHEKMKQSTAVAATPLLTRGRMIRRNIWKRVAPSIIAASSTSLATSSKNDFISSTQIGMFIKVSTRMR